MDIQQLVEECQEIDRAIQRACSVDLDIHRANHYIILNNPGGVRLLRVIRS